jgi:CheY-like chemotaxis protein
MLKALRILVVDDDSHLLELVETYLQAQGHQAVPCDSAEDALAALDRGDFDLLISDIAMAGMDGFELLRITRRRFPRIGIVLMTAYTEKYSLADALAAGADGYVTKPFSLDKLSLIFERAYWNALSRTDWWEAHDDGVPANTRSLP